MPNERKQTDGVPRPPIEEMRTKAIRAAYSIINKRTPDRKPGKAAVLLPLEDFFQLLDYVQDLEEKYPPITTEDTETP